MSAIVCVVLLAAGIMAAIAMITLVMVIIGIHRTERCMSLRMTPATTTEILARKILGVYIREPGTLSAFTPGMTAAPINHPHEPRLQANHLL